MTVSIEMSLEELEELEFMARLHRIAYPEGYGDNQHGRLHKRILSILETELENARIMERAATVLQMMATYDLVPASRQ